MKPGKPTEQPRLDLQKLWERLDEEPPGPVREYPGEDEVDKPRP
ncbi:MAG TPA: hypothetical protein VM784_05080 [Actinomycetota bacterium]|nr:hypothetical protein [Actinomycetota bacterium]